MQSKSFSMFHQKLAHHLQRLIIREIENNIYSSLFVSRQNYTLKVVKITHKLTQ